MFCNYSLIKLRMANKRITRKIPCIWKITNRILSNSEKYLEFKWWKYHVSKLREMLNFLFLRRFIHLFEREKESVCMHTHAEGSDRRGQERISSRLPDEWGALCRTLSHNPKITTWTEITSQLLCWLSP